MSLANLLRRTPAALIVFRAGAALAVIPVGWWGRGKLLALIIVLATLSDLLDGIIARLLGVSTTNLRRADSIVDLIFWLSTLAALYLLRPAAITANAGVVAFVLGAEIVQQGMSVVRFGRLTATHARSASFMGACLLIGMTMLALGGNSAFAFWIIAFGTAVAALDGWAIVLLLPHWEADIPSAVDAWRLRQGLAIKRHWLG